MTRVRLLRKAEEELEAAARYYEAEQAGLGAALLQEIRGTLLRIGEKPFASRVERGDIRVRTVGRFPYRIYYRAGADGVLLSRPVNSA
jgi:plasmid stabilization system protein ParE